MLGGIQAGGGTVYHVGVAVFQMNGVRIPEDADLILFAVGDEAGESGEEFARQVESYGYKPSAIAHIVNVASGWERGQTLRRGSEVMGVPYTEVDVDQFRDVYQVQRTLKAVLETGKPPLKTRALYLLFAATAPFTPSRCRSENWP